jgi:hypothetical protein
VFPGTPASARRERVLKRSGSATAAREGPVADAQKSACLRNAASRQYVSSTLISHSDLTSLGTLTYNPGLLLSATSASPLRLKTNLGLWRIPNFAHAVWVDTPSHGVSVACQKHYRRLTQGDAARRLPSVHARTGQLLYVHLLSGRDHWPMTAFCVFSLLRCTSANIVPMIVDDGTLSERERDALREISPALQFSSVQECREQVERCLPPSRFPALRKLHSSLPLMRKLLDVHAGRKGWRLFLDSDILFYREPVWLLDWLRSPERPVYMLDYQNSYGYSDSLLCATMGAPTPANVNTGLCGLRSDEIDWELLECWASRLYSEGVNHYSEQCLTAMLMGMNRSRPAPWKDYRILPDRAEVRHPTAAMHHYVAESRVWYYVDGWPRIARDARRRRESPVDE